VRDHLHVAEVASGLVALLSPGATGIFNVCAGQPARLRQVLETVADIMGGQAVAEIRGAAASPERDQVPGRRFDPPAGLGWSPQFGLRDGLEDALRGYF
jgi:dTDP-glucose 4,6-dehydratase